MVYFSMSFIEYDDVKVWYEFKLLKLKSHFDYENKFAQCTSKQDCGESLFLIWKTLYWLISWYDAI